MRIITISREFGSGGREIENDLPASSALIIMTKKLSPLLQVKKD